MSRGGGRNLSSSRAFTLAEVLVTLGIIGVVSAMTVPTLMQNHQRKTYVTQLHKVYNEMQQAFLQEITDKNALNLKEAGLTTDESVVNFMKKRFKVIQDCEDKFEPCFADEYSSMDGSKRGALVNCTRNPYSSCYTIASGASICLGELSTENEEQLSGALYVDINGQKGPNVGGRDMFTMRYYNDGSIDVYRVTPECRVNSASCVASYGSEPKEIRENRFNGVCVISNEGDDCIGKLLNDNWEMNY